MIWQGKKRLKYRRNIEIDSNADPSQWQVGGGERKTDFRIRKGPDQSRVRKENCEWKTHGAQNHEISEMWHQPSLDFTLQDSLKAACRWWGGEAGPELATVWPAHSRGASGRAGAPGDSGLNSDGCLSQSLPQQPGWHSACSSSSSAEPLSATPLFFLLT